MSEGCKCHQKGIDCNCVDLIFSGIKCQYLTELYLYRHHNALFRYSYSHIFNISQEESKNVKF